MKSVIRIPSSTLAYRTWGGNARLRRQLQAGELVCRVPTPRDSGTRRIHDDLEQIRLVQGDNPKDERRRQPCGQGPDVCCLVHPESGLDREGHRRLFVFRNHGASTLSENLKAVGKSGMERPTGDRRV